MRSSALAVVAVAACPRWCSRRRAGRDSTQAAALVGARRGIRHVAKPGGRSRQVGLYRGARAPRDAAARPMTGERALRGLREAERRFARRRRRRDQERTAQADFNLDQINEGRVLFALADATHDPRYGRAAATLRAQLARNRARPDGGFWHKQIYPEQMWLDGLYMAEPFYAQFAARHADTAAMTDVTRQFLIVAQHLRDSTTGLYYHAWDSARRQPWADPATGRSKNFWGRAVGWYLMAAIDVLDYLPANHPNRPALVRIVQDSPTRRRACRTRAAYGGKCSINRIARAITSRNRRRRCSPTRSPRAREWATSRRNTTRSPRARSTACCISS